MNFEEVKASLLKEFQRSDLALKISEAGSQLVIVMSRPASKADFNYEAVASQISAKLVVLNPPNASTVKFYGRQSGASRPEWQKIVSLGSQTKALHETPISEKSSVKTLVTTKESPTQLLTLLNPLWLQATGLVCLVGILGILSFNAFVGQKPKPVVWEYRIEAVSDFTFTETMNSYGADGWELVFARRAQDSITETFSYECIFKRQKR